MNLRPMIIEGNGKVEQMVTDIDVLFVIDNTLSMRAEDYNGSIPRMTAVKNDCEHIIANLPGAKYSVIKFENSSTIMIPFTNDANKAIQSIKSLSELSKYSAKGSSLNVAKEDMKRQLDRDKKDEKMVVFFISDGEITGKDDLLESYKDLESYIDDGAVLGYGTEAGGKMKIIDYDGSIIYLEDPTTYDADYKHPPGISKIDEGNLKKIASDLGIDYVHMDRQSNIDSKIEDIKKVAKKNVEDKEDTIKTDLYYIFLVPLTLLVLYEVFDYKRKAVV